MRIGRPITAAVTPSTDRLTLVEHLVEKTLQINPQLAAGQPTEQAVRHLRATVRLPRPEVAPQTLESPAPVADELQPDAARRATFSFFFRKKEEELRAEAAAIDAQIAALARKKTELQRRVQKELTDFVVMMPGDVRSADARASLRDSKDLLAQLDVSEGELVRAMTRAAGERQGRRSRIEAGSIS